MLLLFVLELKVYFTEGIDHVNHKLTLLGTFVYNPPTL